MSEPIRILHVFSSVNRGGAESRTLDLYRHIDRQKVQFDFLVNTNPPGDFATEIEEMGGRIFFVPRFTMINYFSYRRAVTAFFGENHDFHVVQGHLTSSAAIYLLIAKKAGVPVTIAHARNTNAEPGIKRLLTHIMQRKLYRKADLLFTCSQLAGEAFFGRKAVAAGLVTLIPNAIESRNFDFCDDKRKLLRRELELEGKFVIGHVGSFTYAKNHGYLLKIFNEIQKEVADACLLLVGGGGGRQQIEQLAEDMELTAKIIWAGKVSNPEDYYQAFDYFVFPSYYEGLPGVVLEAQAAGLHCLISDTITQEVAVTDLITFMSIKENPAKWARMIIDSRNYTRLGRVQTLVEAGYDAYHQAKKMEEIYLSQPQKQVMLIVPNLTQGGFEHTCVKTARLLSPIYKVVIVVFSADEIAYDVSGLDVVNIRCGVKKSPAAKMLNVFIRVRKVRKLKRLHQTDIAYSFGITANIVNALSKIGQAKTWLSLRHFDDVGRKRFIRLFLNRADRIISCSQEIEVAMHKEYGYDKAVTLYNPYDIAGMCELAKSDVADLPWSDEAEYLVAMGREDDYKGFWHTIKILYLVKQKLPQKKLRLLIIGKGEFSEYKELAYDLGVSEHVYFTGGQRNPFIYLKKGAIFLLTSTAEGFPNALVEAMAMGLAVISSDCPTGPAEILLKDTPPRHERKEVYQQEAVIWGDYGILVPEMGTERKFAPDYTIEEERTTDIVVTLLSEPATLSQYQKAASQRAADFTTEKYVSKMMNWIENE
ncbi:MAG: glycosyltransferase [Lachnospiraceae bacterium]|jgi:glycosyltransferase involved in cell wall biosynthesis|nr:glycosyltransferase [Lachnospiraceae bacterium]